jgi:hypothetical protein
LRKGDRSRPAGLLVAALLCFAVAAVSFGGLILRTDYAGRAIFGAAWGALGVVWLGKYFVGGRGSRDSRGADAEDREA